MLAFDKFFQILSNHKATLAILLVATIIFVLSFTITCTHLGLKYEIKGGVDIKIVNVEFKISSHETNLPEKKT